MAGSKRTAQLIPGLRACHVGAMVRQSPLENGAVGTVSNSTASERILQFVVI